MYYIHVLEIAHIYTFSHLFEHDCIRFFHQISKLYTFYKIYWLQKTRSKTFSRIIHYTFQNCKEYLEK